MQGVIPEIFNIALMLQRLVDFFDFSLGMWLARLSACQNLHTQNLSGFTSNPQKGCGNNHSNLIQPKREHKTVT